MILKLNEPVTSDHESFYVILVTLRGERPVEDKSATGRKRFRTEYYDYNEFFQADRYQPYGPRLRTVCYATDAKKWQTPDGAQKALARLKEKETITDRHNAVVVKYTRFRTEQYDVVAEPAVVSAN